MNNSMQTQAPQKMTFSQAVVTPKYQTMISTALKDPKRVTRYIAGITSAVATNPTLQQCTPQSVLSGSLLGESLGLSPSPQLGQYYLVPFNNKKTGRKDAQFQMGYKGYIQLALRSGYYADLDCIEIREGEYKGRNKSTGKREFEFVEDDDIREALPISGYLASFEYLNGFKKAIYWTRGKVEAHAMKFSKGYAAKKGYTFWEKDFDSMAQKTLLRQLISKWGIMSIDLQSAFEAELQTETADVDSDLISECDSDMFIDADATVIEPQAGEPAAVPKEPAPVAEGKQVNFGDL